MYRKKAIKYNAIKSIPVRDLKDELHNSLIFSRGIYINSLIMI